MKAEDLRAKSPDELKKELMDLKKEAFNLRFQRATGQLENTARVRRVVGATLSTLPRLPLSLPEMTTTSSPFLMRSLGLMGRF